MLRCVCYVLCSVVMLEEFVSSFGCLFLCSVLWCMLV